MCTFINIFRHHVNHGTNFRNAGFKKGILKMYLRDNEIDNYISNHTMFRGSEYNRKPFAKAKLHVMNFDLERGTIYVIKIFIVPR